MTSEPGNAVADDQGSDDLDVVAVQVTMAGESPSEHMTIHLGRHFTFHTNTGYLTVKDEKHRLLAVFPPGAWTSVSLRVQTSPSIPAPPGMRHGTPRPH